MSTNVFNLRARFGKRFKIDHDEAYSAEHGDAGRVDDPQLQIIPGARGHVYAWDTTRLAAFVRAGATASKLKALPFVEVWTDGSDGATVLFPADKLEEVAVLLRLRRRRRVSDRERARLAELGRRHGFQPRQAGLQSNSEARPCVPTAPGRYFGHAAHPRGFSSRETPVVRSRLGGRPVAAASWGV